MSDKKYNGWTNYETWNVALWLGNEQGSDLECSDMADRAIDRNEGDKDAARTSMADQLKDMIEEQAAAIMPNAGMFTDLLNAALSEVDWEEIASHYVEQSAECLDA